MDKTPFPSRPTPKFYFETNFSTKREKSQTPREKPPPPLKSISRKSLFTFSNMKAQNEERARIVSINPSKNTFLETPYYNPDSNELYFEQVFDVICQIGSGSFGEVYKVRCKCDNEFYAIKKTKQKFKSSVDRLNKLAEANRYEELPYHRNCVKFIKAWEEREQLYIQTELCKTSLSDYADEHHNIPDKQIWNYLVDLLMAVKHLHDHNLIHLDIKPENVFVNYDDVCKLGDFGLVLNLNEGKVDSAIEGDGKYMAPELLQGNFNKPADIFSLGITILELACDLDLPKGDELWHQLRSKILPEDLLKDKPEELQFCIRWMMEPDPTQRPTVDQILNHPFVRDTWQQRLQEQIELENKPKIKTSPRKARNKLWSSESMQAIAEKSHIEESDMETATPPVISSNFSPPLISHPFLEKEASFNSSHEVLNSSGVSIDVDSPDSQRNNRFFNDHAFNVNSGKIVRNKLFMKTENKTIDSNNSADNGVYNTDTSFINGSFNHSNINFNLDDTDEDIRNNSSINQENNIHPNLNKITTVLNFNNTNKRSKSKNSRTKKNLKNAIGHSFPLRTNLFNDTCDGEDMSEN